MQKILYASDYARLDSNVQTGGGTDETEILQSLLDKAASWGSLKLIMDGAALVRGLKVHSNTTIECLNKDCGFFLADHADCAVLANDVFSYGERKTRNVTLIGGTYNHNCLHQAHHIFSDDPAMVSDAPDNGGQAHYTVAMEFIGVENLTVRDVTVRDQRTFAFTVGNFSHVTIENTWIELVHEIEFGNQDGFHFWGPGQFLTMRDVGGKTEDDFMNIGPDERDSVSSITDVLIDGVFLDHAWQGIRLLSKNAGTLDRVTIRNVTGTYRLYGFYLNPWFIQPTNGHFGNITFENIDLRPENQEEDSDYTRLHPRFLFSIGGDFECLTFRNIHWYHPRCNWNLFQIGFPYYDIRHPFLTVPRIRTMLVDGLTVLEDEQQAAATDYLVLRGRVDRLTLRDVSVLAPNRGSRLLRMLPDGDLGLLSLERVDAEHLDCLLDLTEGKTGCVMLQNVVTSDVPQPCIGKAAHIAGSVLRLDENKEEET